MSSPGDGRNQVVDDELLDIGWGNAVADRTWQSYASQADRNTQWPTPRTGATCYTADTDEFWIYRAGAWKRLPVGFLSTNTGPGLQTDCTASLVSLLQVSITAKVGRHYLVNAYVNGRQITNGGTGITGAQVSDDQGGQQWIAYANNLPVNFVQLGSTSYLYTPTSTKTGWVRISAQSSATGGAIRFGVNACRLTVSDLGG